MGFRNGIMARKLWPELLDDVRLFRFSLGEEIGAALFVFCDPVLCEAAIADFRQELFHVFARLLRDDARARHVVAVLGGVADRVAHVAEPAAIDKIDDELQFVQALEVSDFGLIPGIRRASQIPL